MGCLEPPPMALRVPTQKESLAFTMTGGFHPLFTFILAAPDGSLLFYMAPPLWRSLWITLTHQFFFFFLRLRLAFPIFPECQVFLILLMEDLGSQKISELRFWPSREWAGAFTQCLEECLACGELTGISDIIRVSSTFSLLSFSFLAPSVPSSFVLSKNMYCMPVCFVPF